MTPAYNEEKRTQIIPLKNGSPRLTGRGIFYSDVLSLENAGSTAALGGAKAHGNSKLGEANTGPPRRAPGYLLFH